MVREMERNAGKKESPTYVHIDASQAPLWLPCAMDSLGVDLMTLDAGKCYGPKGVGVLAHKRQVPLVTNLFGGDQEVGLRPGTENVPSIVGCAHALTVAQKPQRLEARARKTAVLRDMLFSELEKSIPEMVVNGSREHRVVNNCNISIPGIDGEFAVVTLDTHGIAASTRSACAGGKGGGSHVVAEITGDADRANNTIRFTLGEETTTQDILRTVNVLSQHVNAVRNSGE
jgi:cysteine desulfurase